MPQIINNHVGCAYYNADQLCQLNDIITNLAARGTGFKINLNFDDIRSKIANMMEVIQEEPIHVEDRMHGSTANVNSTEDKNAVKANRKNRVVIGFAAIIAVISTGAILIHNNLRKA